jgi:hypothetical protein
MAFLMHMGVHKAFREIDTSARIGPAMAKGTANEKVSVRKPSVRVPNLNEVERVATWEEDMMGRRAP